MSFRSENDGKTVRSSLENGAIVKNTFYTTCLSDSEAFEKAIGRSSALMVAMLEARP